MSPWLIRNRKNEIVGPVTREVLIEKIKTGQLTQEDEVCLANHYWIHLDEREEVHAQLGIEMPRPGRIHGDEITLTDTAPIASHQHYASASTASDAVPASSAAPTRSHRPVVVGRAETVVLWRYGALLLVFTTCGFVFWILKILQEAANFKR
jgi:hypothetical protein